MNSIPQDFQTLLAETGIEFQPTPDFVICPVGDNSVFRYQYAMRSPSGALEMRLRIDSLARLEAECKTGMEDVDLLARVSLNKSYTTNFVALIHNLSNGQFVDPTVMSPESTALLYNADWCALCFMRLPDNGFAPDYNSAYVLAIHKNDVADIYVIGLYNDINGTTGNFNKNDLPTDVKKYLVPTLRFI